MKPQTPMSNLSQDTDPHGGRGWRINDDSVTELLFECLQPDGHKFGVQMRPPPKDEDDTWERVAEGIARNKPMGLFPPDLRPMFQQVEMTPITWREFVERGYNGNEPAPSGRGWRWNEAAGKIELLFELTAPDGGKAGFKMALSGGKIARPGPCADAKIGAAIEQYLQNPALLFHGHRQQAQLAELINGCTLAPVTWEEYVEKGYAGGKPDAEVSWTVKG